MTPIPHIPTLVEVGVSVKMAMLLIQFRGHLLEQSLVGVGLLHQRPTHPHSNSLGHHPWGGLLSCGISGGESYSALFFARICRELKGRHWVHLLSRLGTFMSPGCSGLNIRTQAGPLKDPGQTWNTEGLAEPEVALHDPHLIH